MFHRVIQKIKVARFLYFVAMHSSAPENRKKITKTPIFGFKVI